MIIRINGTKSLPIETKDKDLDPIIIRAAVGDADGRYGWASEQVDFELDSGSDVTVIPLPLLSKLLGENLKLDAQAKMETADGQISPVNMTKISVRIKTTNGEIVALHAVECSAPESGTALLGRNVLQVFRLVIVQNKLQEIILNPKTSSWLMLSE